MTVQPPPPEPDPRGDPLPMWTVYDHPSDYPNNYVARQVLIWKDGSQTSPQFMIGPDLKMIREQLMMMGLTCIGRQPGDDPVIVEVWL